MHISSNSGLLMSPLPGNLVVVYKRQCDARVTGSSRSRNTQIGTSSARRDENFIKGGQFSRAVAIHMSVAAG